MKKIFLILSLVVFSTSAFGSKAWGEEIMVNNKEAKIRNGPGTNYTILWKPRLYTPLEVLAKWQDWYAVRDVEKDVGWVHNSAVSKDPSAIVTEKIIDVHESDDGKSRVVYQAPKNYTFKIVETKEGWASVVDTDGEKGWIETKGVWTGTGEKSQKAEPKKEGKKSKKKEKAKEHKHAEKKKSVD
jgi:SH3-like domain-containing protein